jgi:hypothetical protein
MPSVHYCLFLKTQLLPVSLAYSQYRQKLAGFRDWLVKFEIKKI